MSSNFGQIIKEEKEDFSDDLFGSSRDFKIVIDPITKTERSLFYFNIFDHENVALYELLNGLPQKPKIFPKIYSKTENEFLLQPLKKNLKTVFINEKAKLQFKGLLSIYKTLLNGLAFLQVMGISAVLNSQSIYLSENNEVKVVFYEKINNVHSKVLDFAKVILAIGLGEEIFLDKEVLGEKVYGEILDSKIQGFLLSLQVINNEEKSHLGDLAHNLEKILQFDNEEKMDFMQLFLQSLKYKSPDSLKKIICIEETHGLEISYDILITKDTMKFELNSSNFKIFGISSVPIERTWDKTEEVKNAIEEIKPIKSINLRISNPNSSQLEQNTLDVLETISNKKNFRLDDFKSFTLQATPSKSLVKESHWYKFLWHAFYKCGENHIENSGLSLVKEHFSDW